MADDKRISELDELLGGGLHDDIQHEVYDPNEALPEDQNKRVKLLTLLAYFGALDKIFEGDSSVEVIDTGTGSIVFTVDAVQEADINASGLKLKAGSRVNEIETSLTNDATHIPDSAAVFAALAAISPNKIEQLNSKVEVIDAGAGVVEITLDGTVMARFNNGTDVRLGNFSAPTEIFISGSSDEIFITSADEVQIKSVAGATKILDGTPKIIASFSGGGMSLETGSQVNEIEAALTNDAAHIPTSAAVFAAIGAVAPDKISEGNSSVEVIDTGAGQLDFTIDGSLRGRIQLNNWAFWNDSGIFEMGRDDLDHAELRLYGSNSLSGGSLKIYNGASSDSTVDHYMLWTDDEHFYIGPNTDNDALQWDAPNAQWIFNTPNAVVMRRGLLDVGLDNIFNGILEVFGNSTTLGGVINVYTPGNFDTIIELYKIQTSEDDFIIGPDTDPDSLKHHGADSIWEFTNPAGVKVNDCSGGEAIGNVASTVSVTFGTVKSNATYQVLATVENITDGSPLVLSAIITAKATTGFTATLSAATDSANYVLNWLIVRS